MNVILILVLGALLGAFLMHIWHDSMEDIRWWRSRPDIRGNDKADDR